MATKEERAALLEAIEEGEYAPELLAEADDSLKADREIVLEVVKQDGRALWLADDSLKSDREVVLAAVKQDGRALKDASEELQQDEELQKIAEEADG